MLNQKGGLLKDGGGTLLRVPSILPTIVLA